MIRKLVITAACLLLAGCGQRPEKGSHLHTSEPFRIVSLAPNVTEILYALGLSNEVAGVSRYSEYPPEAAEKPKVGGTYDPNWEQIIALRPDLVIGLDSQQEIAAQIKQLGIDFLGVPHERVSEIMQSILIIGEACGVQEQAQQLFQTLEAKVGQASSLSAPAKPNDGGRAGSLSDPEPRVLVCIGHDDQLTRMYIAAKNTFYDDLINLAGGINACEQTAVKYPEISPEALHALAPDVILDVFPDIGNRRSLHPSTFSRLWKHPNVVALTNDYSFIPGPRFVLLLNDLTDAIHKNISE
jgi:iron complex transport system substrate-binding protein